MKISIKKINPDVVLELSNSELVGIWNELERLTDRDFIIRESELFKLKLLIKNNITDLYKLVDGNV